ncbi:hypothetical protein ACWDG1_34765 [Streptomyces sp. NPDC001177]
MVQAKEKSAGLTLKCLVKVLAKIDETTRIGHRDAVPIPAKTTGYELLRELEKGTNAFEGNAKGKHSIANRPQGVYGRLRRRVRVNTWCRHQPAGRVRDGAGDLSLGAVRAHDRGGAEVLCRQAASTGYTMAMSLLYMMQAGAGGWDGAEATARQAADAGDNVDISLWEKDGTERSFSLRGRWPYGLGPEGKPTPPWQ